MRAICGRSDRSYEIPESGRSFIAGSGGCYWWKADVGKAVVAIVSADQRPPAASVLNQFGAAELHVQERALATRFAREQERQRLMRDLHDGLSGHIVSIIALAERGKQFDIEQAAREALDDLRLVVQSLDIGSEDLPVVLGYFRERITPLFRRLGIELKWSTVPAPVIDGLTPATALSLLRILQEAVTNAIRHGPARCVSITISASETEGTEISVENDGRSTPVDEGCKGNGLHNMQHRAELLGGRIELVPSRLGMRLRLILPPSLTGRALLPMSSEQSDQAIPLILLTDRPVKGITCTANSDM